MRLEDLLRDCVRVCACACTPIHVCAQSRFDSCVHHGASWYASFCAHLFRDKVNSAAVFIMMPLWCLLYGVSFEIQNWVSAVMVHLLILVTLFVFQNRVSVLDYARFEPWRDEWSLGLRPLWSRTGIHKVSNCSVDWTVLLLFQNLQLLLMSLSVSLCLSLTGCVCTLSLSKCIYIYI